LELRSAFIFEKIAARRLTKMVDTFSHHVQLRKRTLGALTDSNPENLYRAIDQIIKTFTSHGKLFICGNGGSAADAQHIAAEFVNGMTHPNGLHLPAIALTTDTSVLTAHANDYSFQSIFEVQLKALSRPGDCVLFLTTSGKSSNIVKAIEYCTEMDLPAIVITGNHSNLDNFDLISIKIPTVDTQIIQEMSLILEHYVCLEVIAELQRLKTNRSEGVSSDIN
jgi:D-sedoheptulose 7-phosphate isomerase